MPDPWLTNAFDQHADQLYVYSRFLLREPDDAADAVEQTFLVAAARLGDVPEAGLTRAWLFALARNECLRQTRPGPPPGPADSDPAALQAAVCGLSPAAADVIGMYLHGLDIPDIAEVLGLPQYESLALVSQSRDDLEAALPATAQLSLTRDALLGSALTSEALRYAHRVTIAMRDQVLDAADITAAPNPAALRTARRAGPFRSNGFPKPLSPDGGGRRPRRTALAVLGAVGVAAVVAGAVVAIGYSVHRSANNVVVNSQAGQAGGGGMALPTLVSLTPVTVASTATSPSPSRSPSASPSPSRSSASPAVRTSSPAAGTLLVSPAALTVSERDSGRLTLAAEGGAVTWSISVSGRHLELSQTSGTLQSGQSTSIRVSATRSTFSGATLTVTTSDGKSARVNVSAG